MLSARILLQLLKEAEDVPIMFAVLLPSGNVMLEVLIYYSFCLFYLLHYAQPTYNTTL